MKMKAILASILLLTVAEATPYRSFNGGQQQSEFSIPNFGYNHHHGRHPGGYQHFPPPPHQHHQQQQPYMDYFNVDANKAEWICRSPKTGSVMIITSEEGKQDLFSGSYCPPVQNQQNQGCENQSPESPTTVEPKPIENEPIKTHGGEGMIDVRFGDAESSK